MLFPTLLCRPFFLFRLLALVQFMQFSEQLCPQHLVLFSVEALTKGLRSVFFLLDHFFDRVVREHTLGPQVRLTLPTIRASGLS